MSWIQTHSGRRFDPSHPSADDFDINDIAHALSHLCRFNGHCKRFYSVAEHSVRVSHACAPETALWGLLHDMGEAYVGDLPRPIKAVVPEHERFENDLLTVALPVFGLNLPMPESVKVADDTLLATEARDLMGVDAKTWGITEEPQDEAIEPWSPEAAKAAFLKRFEELRGSATAP
jgi:hypothetical protein